MPIKFVPNYTITPKIALNLMRIEAAREKVSHLPLTTKVSASLRETARLYTTHYSTMIEGNRLEPAQIKEVLKHEGHFPGRERDEHEVSCCWRRCRYISSYNRCTSTQRTIVLQKILQTLYR